MTEWLNWTELNWTELMGPDAMIFIFWMLSYKPTFSLSSLNFIKRLFSYSLFTIRVVPPAYLRLLLYPLVVFTPACDSYNLTFCMMYSEYKLNKQGDNIQPYHTPFPVLKQSIVSCPVLTVPAWPAYRFHRRQVRWSVTKGEMATLQRRNQTDTT